ncbi:hypothetical protein DBB34_06535 [Sphaerisporangium cinnabarinum]|nr:hypothetical protein [Sphaerisporangium cinnabarinum]PTU56964.1 hypothetical protein DBB34_06535 [Sphaerisporangium cinnabarinum]
MNDETHSHRTSAALEALADATRKRQARRAETGYTTAMERLRATRNPPDKQTAAQALRRHLTR